MLGLANAIRLVQPAKYAASLTGGINSTYGTPQTPYVSYGAYIIKNWDENQMLVFNKNYEYVARGTISHKSQVLQIVESIKLNLTWHISLDYLTMLNLLNQTLNVLEGFPQYIV